MDIISNKIKLHKSEGLLSYCKKNLVLDNPEYLTKVKMNFYIGNTAAKLHLYEIKGEYIILPFGELKNIWQFVDKKDYILDFVNNPINVESKENINLYDYQEKAVVEAINNKNGILVSPAGSGKTTMGVEIIYRLKQKTLWLVHTKDLLQQSKKRFQGNYNASVGEITDGKVNIQDVTFATIQTVANMDINTIAGEFGLIIIDECHRAAASPTRLSMFGKVIGGLKARYKIGLTATPHRADGLIKATYSLIGDIFHVVDKEKVSGKTMKAEIWKVKTDFKLEYMGDSYNADGTINYVSMITEIAKDNQRNGFIVALIKSLYEQGKNIIVLSDRVFQLETINKCVEKGVMVTGKTPKKKREQWLEDMRTGNERILYSSYSLAKEGLDIPVLDCLIMITPKKDKAVIIQSVGRIERKIEGKNTPQVFDIIDEIGICKRMSKQRDRIYKQNDNQQRGVVVFDV